MSAADLLYYFLNGRIIYGAEEFKKSCTGSTASVARIAAGEDGVCTRQVVGTVFERIDPCRNTQDG